ncbi:hypothetical protein LINGRAPRIM_LOCUS2071 [Linum grandiflorum]
MTDYPPSALSFTGYLPFDLLEKVLSCVAANSLTNLVNCKKTCTVFCKLASNDRVFQNVTLLDAYFRHRYFELHHKNNFFSFMDRCINNNNIEALFCCEIEDYFLGDGGITKLRVAADKWMIEARYAYGIISLRTEEHPTILDEAFTVLHCLRKVDDIICCRKTMKDVVRMNMIVRINNKTHRLFSRLERSINYGTCGCKLMDKSLTSFSKNSNFGWLPNKDQVIDLVDSSNLCDYCFWKFETSNFVELYLG